MLAHIRCPSGYAISERARSANSTVRGQLKTSKNRWLAKPEGSMFGWGVRTRNDHSRHCLFSHPGPRSFVIPAKAGDPGLPWKALIQILDAGLRWSWNRRRFGGSAVFSQALCPLSPCALAPCAMLLTAPPPPGTC
jgi:hypothetical protein